MSLHAVSGKHQDGTAWAKTPPPGGARGSRWEAAILELAEAGEPRFVEILAGTSSAASSVPIAHAPR